MVQAVTVNNFSFEDDGVEIDPGIPTGWYSDSTGDADIGVAAGGASLTDGSYRLWMGNNVTLYQNTSTEIGSAGASYTLQVDVYNSWNANPQIILYYDDAGTRVPLGEAHYLASDFPDSGTWVESHTLELTVVTTAASVGKNLGIELSIENYPGDVWAHYDNVRLASNTVILVSPANNTDLVPKTTDLVWTVAPTVEKVDLYLGLEDDPNLTLNPLLFVPDIPAATTSYSPTLDYSTPYYWKVVAYEPNTLGTGYITSDSGTASFTTAGPAPVITAITPYAQSVPAGTTSTTITVSGVNLEFFAWSKDGAPLSDGSEYTGTGTATLTILDVQLADEGVYSCEVSNSLSVVTDTANAVVVTERLMSWWKLDGNLNDSVQDVVAEAPQYNGVLDPNTVFTADASGIDSGDSVVLDIGDPNVPVIPIAGTEEIFNFYEDSLTVSAWVRTTYVSDTAWPAVVSKTPAQLVGYTIALDGQSEVLAQVDGDSTRLYTNWLVADGDWHMVTLTYDGSEQRIYVDGELDTSTTGVTSVSGISAVGNTAPVIIGAWNLTSQEFGAEFEGNIDNVKIYSYALTATEVGEDYVATNPNVDYVCNWELPDLVYDSDGNCRVDLVDLADFATKWLNCNRIPDTACLE